LTLKLQTDLMRTTISTMWKWSKMKYQDDEKNARLKSKKKKNIWNFHWRREWC